MSLTNSESHYKRCQHTHSDSTKVWLTYPLYFPHTYSEVTSGRINCMLYPSAFAQNLLPKHPGVTCLYHTYVLCSGLKSSISRVYPIQYEMRLRGWPRHYDDEFLAGRPEDFLGQSLPICFLTFINTSFATCRASTQRWHRKQGVCCPENLGTWVLKQGCVTVSVRV